MIENKKIAVYSVFFGVTQRATINRNYRPRKYPHYFISNNIDILNIASSLGWTCIHTTELGFPIDDEIISCHQGKLPKVMPHVFEILKDYDYLLFKDDKQPLDNAHPFDMDVIESYVNELEESNLPMMIHRHNFLDKNILFEFAEAMKQPRYRNQLNKIVDYITEEVNAGYKLNCGTIYWCGWILRNMRHSLTNEIGEMWYQHILRCGIEDQISFDFVAQRYPTSIFLK